MNNLINYQLDKIYPFDDKKMNYQDMLYFLYDGVSTKTFRNIEILIANLIIKRFLKYKTETILCVCPLRNINTIKYIIESILKKFYNVGNDEICSPSAELLLLKKRFCVQFENLKIYQRKYPLFKENISTIFYIRGFLEDFDDIKQDYKTCAEYINSWLIYLNYKIQDIKQYTIDVKFCNIENKSCGMYILSNFDLF